MSGFGTTQTDSLEVITAYIAQSGEIPAVAADPGWRVLGAFFLPISSSARVELIGSVSNVILTLTVRLFDMTTGAPVSGSTVQVVTTTDDRELSGVFQLLGGHLYQFQAEVTGAAGTAYFGKVKSASLTG